MKPLATIIRRESTLYNDPVKASHARLLELQWRHDFRLLRWKDDERGEDHPNAQNFLDHHRALAAKFIGDGSFEPIEERWRRIHYNRRRSVSIQVLVGCLARSAKDGLTALRCMPFAMPNFSIRADSLFNLRYGRWEEIQADRELSKLFWNEVHRLRKPDRWPTKRMRDSHLDLLLQNTSEQEQRVMLLNYWEKYCDQPVKDSTLLSLVDYHIRINDSDSALSMLRRVSAAELQSKSPDVMRRCTNLLRLETVLRDGQSHSFKVLPAMLEMGVPPDDIIYDYVTYKSVRLELPAVAWDIFRHAKGQGVTLSPRVHLMLLKDSHLRKDANAMNEMLSTIQKSADLYQHPPIVAYMIHVVRSICIYERGTGPGETLARMLPIYDKAYPRAPLERLGIVRPRKTQLGDIELPEPSPLSLAFLIFSYVMIQRDEWVVDHFWDMLTAKLDKQDPEIQQAATHSLFYDGFIRFYAKQESTIPRALTVLRYMLQHDKCRPGHKTWSMVIEMFLKHRQEESAEEIRQLMLQRNVPVTQEAWKYILRQYAHTDIAIKVNKILNPSLDMEHQDDDKSQSDRTAEPEEKVEEDIDVTKEQADPGYRADLKPNPAWTEAPGLDSVQDLGQKNVVRKVVAQHHDTLFLDVRESLDVR
jgi:pentatricopeptide repeat protein